MSTDHLTKENYDKLIDKLKQYEDQYYSADSTVSDGEFDSLYQQALKIERLHPTWLRNDSPTQRVMSPNALQTIKHKIPCLSLGKVMTFDELLIGLRKQRRNYLLNANMTV